MDDRDSVSSYENMGDFLGAGRPLLHRGENSGHNGDKTTEYQENASEVKALFREQSINLERIDSLQTLLHSTMREKAHLELTLQEMHKNWSDREQAFQETINSYGASLNAEKEFILRQLDELKALSDSDRTDRLEEKNALCKMMDSIIQSDKTPFLAFQFAKRRTSYPFENNEILQRIQQLCHKISIQQLAAERRVGGIQPPVPRKPYSRSRSRGRKPAHRTR